MIVKCLELTIFKDIHAPLTLCQIWILKESIREKRNQKLTELMPSLTNTPIL